ncbi:sensor histidine kinase [Halalkalibacter alkalisediminis]|uniref:histidine kinase n=1 Tax=Halalkalibacter alkalisediminis TaxID=935616 RepID=A0ABV6NM76_9BACI|nr:HAMP domain-containing sensor histidine kinase [Halalkalibacter alkalisediminis]
MKEFYNQLHKKVYYIVMLSIIAFMAMGLFIENPFDFNIGYMSHMVLVVILTILLLIYPRFETHVFRTLLIIIGTIYFYTLFFLYPETLSLFVFLCVIPAFSILFFDAKLFYLSLFFNSLLIACTFCFIILFDYSNNFSHLKMDLIGNVINFISIQVILFFIFHLSYLRIKKQRLYYEQMQQSERLKTTGQLTAAVAHEIRNPLTVVKGFLQFYEKDQSLNNETKKNFTLMIDELKTAEHVISQFLMIAKPDKDKKMERVDVKAALQSITDLLKSYGIIHDNSIELSVEENCYIAVHLIEFKQLMINFIKNAIEASDKGDSVIVKAERKKGYVEMKIMDQGCGMSEEEVKSLGTPFYSLKSKGTGLGLMICFNIVEKYNGTIHFTSSKGEGTMVTIKFPLDKQ